MSVWRNAFCKHGWLKGSRKERLAYCRLFSSSEGIVDEVEEGKELLMRWSNASGVDRLFRLKSVSTGLDQPRGVSEPSFYHCGAVLRTQKLRSPIPSSGNPGPPTVPSRFKHGVYHDTALLALLTDRKVAFLITVFRFILIKFSPVLVGLKKVSCYELWIRFVLVIDGDRSYLSLKVRNIITAILFMKWTCTLVWI